MFQSLIGIKRNFNGGTPKADVYIVFKVLFRGQCHNNISNNETANAKWLKVNLCKARG
ncbi:hypothetical protein FDUTEX481_02147 [Tolypothrix sp. PCC 7601]|nr:hypothetical protein FDUTEX481_02147 [Tolypothrix sp. PCC 7601]